MKNRVFSYPVQKVAYGRLLLGLLLLFMSGVASADDAPAVFRVRGQVKEATSGTPLPGVNVVEKGSSRGVTTDANGQYQLDVQTGDAILVFSSIGYAKQEIPVGNRAELNVDMQADTRSLDEVVVQGYGTVRKSDLTGSIAQIKGDRLLDRQATNVAQSLQGRIPGVDVGIN